MSDTRKKNTNWQLTGEISFDMANLAVLMDIRDELQAMRKSLQPLRHLDCNNFLSIPIKLDRISRNTAKPRKAKS